MSPGEFPKLMYNPAWVERYCESLPLWRRILARYFERFKVTKKEYDENFYKIMNN